MPGLLRGIARTAVVAGTATTVSNRVSRRQAGRWARQDQQLLDERQAAYAAPAPAPAPAPPAPQPPAEAGMDDKLTLLTKLGELRSQGVLSEEEFQQQKSRILNS
jgi:hypothetical protein